MSAQLEQRTETQRPRVLLLSFACSPNHGSEPGVGWNRALQTARFCDTCLVCDEQRYGALVREYLDEHGEIPGLSFRFVPRSRWVQWLWKIPGMYYSAYKAWQRDAFRVVRQLHEELQFDLVHQVTFCGYREPSYLWKLDVPFVWGPVGGTQNYPWRFLGLTDWRGMFQESMRNVLNRLQLRFSPRVHRAARRAAKVLAANTTIQRDLANACGIEPGLLLETGLPTVASEPCGGDSAHEELRLLWSGDFSPGKALPLLLEALAQLPSEIPWQLRILGKGRLEPRWRRLAEQRGISDRIQWMGWVPHKEALEQYRWADLFVFTSLRDTSGNVVLEAMSNGVPVVCLDHQGVRDMVTERAGVKISVTTPRQVSTSLAKTLEDLARSPSRRKQLGIGALERARDFLWSKQGEAMAKIYEEILRRELVPRSCEEIDLCTPIG